MPQPHITTDPLLDIRRDPTSITTPDTGGPTWTTKAVAETFFGMSTWHLSHLLRAGRALGQEPPKKSEWTKAMRPWTLHDVEKVAHALCESGAINAHKLRLCMHVVKTVGELNGLV